MRSWLLVWAIRRQLVVSAAGSFVISGLLTLIAGGFATPQLRGPSTTLHIGSLHATMLAMCIAFPVGMGDLELEQRTPRLIAAYRGMFVAVLLSLNGILLVVSHRMRGEGLESIVPDLRTGAIVAGVMSCIARWSSFYAAMAVLLAYAGCLLFAGVSPEGDIEWWARPLVHRASTVDVVLSTVGLMAVCVAWLGASKGAGGSWLARARQR